MKPMDRVFILVMLYRELSLSSPSEGLLRLVGCLVGWLAVLLVNNSALYEALSLLKVGHRFHNL